MPGIAVQPMGHGATHHHPVADALAPDYGGGASAKMP
jgi:hypothetical protein